MAVQDCKPGMDEWKCSNGLSESSHYSRKEEQGSILERMELLDQLFIVRQVGEKIVEKTLMVCVENWRRHMIVCLSLTTNEAIYKSLHDTFLTVIVQLHDWMEARDSYPAMSGD